MGHKSGMCQENKANWNQPAFFLILSWAPEFFREEKKSLNRPWFKHTHTPPFEVFLNTKTLTFSLVFTHGSSTHLH